MGRHLMMRDHNTVDHSHGIRFPKRPSWPMRSPTDATPAPTVADARLGGIVISPPRYRIFLRAPINFAIQLEPLDKGTG
jgi:hypothetical protein